MSEPGTTARWQAQQRSATLDMLNGLFEAARLIPPQSTAPAGSVPLTVISGFLGAGKTTLMNRLLSEPHGRRLAVLVNDFGSINIDAELIRSRSDSAISLTNGCACCTIAGDLTRALLQLVQAPQPPDAIVLEASGAADPRGIAQVALANPALRLDGVLTLVDAETVLARLNDPETGALVAAQLSAADLVVLNKIDLLEGAGDELRATLADRAGGRTVIEAEQANLPADVVLGINAPRRGLLSCDGDTLAAAFASWSAAWTAPLDRTRLVAALDRLPREVIRAKGIFSLSDEAGERCVYQRVGQRSSYAPEPARPDDAGRSSLVVIGPTASFDTGAIARIFDEFSGAA